MRHALEVFDHQGEITALTSRQAEIDAIVQVMDARDCAQLHQELARFTSGLAGSWGYSQRVEQGYQRRASRVIRVQ